MNMFVTRRSLLKIGAFAAPALIVPPKLIVPVGAPWAPFQARAAPLVSANSFSTNFSGAPESPISEGGVWQHNSLLNAKLITVGSPNRAVGTQVGGDPNDSDSYAYLNGTWRPNVSAVATIYKDPTIDTTPGEHEVELLFRVADTSTTTRGYECNYSSIGLYSNIVRWDEVGFKFLTFGSSFTPAKTGDQVKAECITSGRVNTLTSWIKYAVANGGDGVTWKKLARATDSTWLEGAPGIGMWLQDASQFANQQKYGFTTYSVTEI